MSGSLQVLSVGRGDIRIEFERADAAEVQRARRIVTDMLRRGYALLIEVERDGEKRYERALDFDSAIGCYIIADLDTEAAREETEDAGVPDDGGTGEKPVERLPGKRGRKRTGVPMESTNAVAVGRSSGG